MRGANVMRGYWNNPEETRLAFQDGIFRTGDVGYRDADGYFYILDRAKDMIVTGGEMSIPAKSKPSFTSILRFWKQQSSEYRPAMGRVVAASVLRKPGRVLSTDDLVAHCRRFLANYKIPRRIEFSETELPKSGSGKILKRLLRERFWVGQERAVG